MTDSGFEYVAYGPEDGQVRVLVVLLHGYGRNALYMEKMAHAVQALVPNALMICPHAPQAMDTGKISAPGDHVLHVPEEVVAGDDGLYPGLQRQWFPIEGGLKDLLPHMRGIAADLNQLIDQQRDRFGLNDRNIVIMGFSQGAGVALYTAYTRTQEIAGLVCHSTIVIDPDSLAHNLKSAPQTLFLYGTKDPEFPQAMYEQSYHWVRDHTAGRAREEKIVGLGHYTNTQSRKIAAEFIRDRLKG